MQISDLVEQQLSSLAAAERRLQEQIEGMPAARATRVSNQAVAHVSRISEALSATLQSAAEEVSLDLSGGSPSAVATLILDEVNLPEAPSPSTIAQPLSNYRLIAALVRYTHNRIAELTLLRAAYGLRSAPEVQRKLAEHLEEAFLSVERLRGQISRLLHDHESVATSAYHPVCRTCKFWDETRSQNEGPYVACLHPSHIEAGLMVSPHSSCKRHEPRG